MFKVIYTLFPIFLAFIYLIFLFKRKSMDWNIRKGEVCYNCKESMDLDPGVLLARLLDEKDFNTLCKPCSREKKILQLQKPYLKWKFRLQSYVVSKKFKKIYLWVPIIVGSIIIVDVISTIIGSKLHLWPIYGTLNILFYLLFFYKLYYTTIKKPSK